MMTYEDLVAWLLEGDISIQYQVQRDLLDNDDKSLQARIEDEGWGAAFLAKRHDDGHWGRAYYQPKWTSTHYTLLDLRNLCIAPDNKRIAQTLALVLKNEIGVDGGINPSPSISQSDVCINGMFLNFASYFQTNEERLYSIIDYIITQYMKDGGFNCRFNRSGAVHSSLHSTLSVAEGILEYRKNGYTYRVDELKKMELTSREFMLQHHLYQSDKSGEVIDQRFTRLSYPGRWRFDILRALDYFQGAKVAYDPRMDDAIAVLMKKRRADGKWTLQAKHPGAVHFEMEKGGQASRWNTLRALRVLKYYKLL